MDQYQKGMLVLNYLRSLSVHPITRAEAVSDENLEKSYQLIQSNPKITKEEFLTEMGIEEETD
ncbi:MAG: hypothetical protein IJ676_03240 [Clostridia bacterium]|nr:hypothetical protein [Clostridia bacterium]